VPFIEIKIAIYIYTHTHTHTIRQSAILRFAPQ